MNKTQELHDLGQSLWLDNITRDDPRQRHAAPLHGRILDYGADLESDHFRRGDRQHRRLRRWHPGKGKGGKSGEALFVELALEDLRRAADLFRPVFDATDGVDGWVSMEVSPLLANDTAAASTQLRASTGKPSGSNLYVKIPGTPEGVPAIEESIFDGVPINVTLLFSREQYVASAEAYLRGIERRIAAGRDPRVASVASLFVSRWDKAVGDKAPPELRNRLGIAIGGRTYRAYCQRSLQCRDQMQCGSGVQIPDGISR